MQNTALRAIPVLGWLYLVGGAIAVAADRVPASRGLRAADGSGRPPLETAILTQIFGMTWWRIRSGQRARR